ncbi:uncharacterized protein LOC129797850 isoform X2 [Lutzomyia longipalpis]|uniref:uncharacterized protein LOC129797850 isoform X2 n=1 Tax=Lutzomyia longipalpis TaxID=7200 RepID=UPI0024836860|nr:uncharacterized protein LOC129797850 isoform X2 [Lutzomyia longipalpis]
MTNNQRIILEPILEETSDDDEETKELWSISQYETSWSSSSDTGSVIKLDAFNPDADCISERDFLCPPKRRRHEWNDALSAKKCGNSAGQKVQLDALLDEPDFHKRRYRLEENTHDYNSDSESSLSRTSSLIQFESLEKQLQSESQLYSSSPLLFTYDSIDNKYSNSLSAPPYMGATSLDTDKVNRNIVLTDNFFYNSDKTFKTTTGNFSYYNHYVSTGNDSDSLIETSGTSNESDDSIKKCSCTIRGVVDETVLGTKGKSSLENLSEDSGYCEHSIQLRHKNHQSPTKYETDIITPILSCAKQFCRRPVSDPTNGPRYSTYLRQQHCSSPQMNDDRKKATYLCGVCELCGAGKENGDRGVCKCSKLMCRDENEISLATSGGMYINRDLKISTMEQTKMSEASDAKNTGKRNRNLLKTSSHSLPNIFYHSHSDGEDRGIYCENSEFATENNLDSSGSRYVIATSGKAASDRDPYGDFLKVTSFPEGLNIYESANSFDDFDFCSGDQANGDSIAHHNLDLNNFRFPHRSKAPQIAQPKPANVTASCNNLTALDYSEDYYGGLRINKMSSHRRNIATQPRVYIENPEITLMDEISYNFDRNLSIMNDKRDDYEPSLDEPTVGVLCIKPPQPPPRAGKKLTIPSASSPTKTKSTSKDSLTFDRDPTNLVTCYAASLERCNFELADSLSALPQVSDSENELPSYRYNFTVQQHRGLVLSTPNLSSYEHCGGEKRSSVVEDEVSGKKEDREKVFVPGILNTTTSKGSLFKEVSFHPIVSEISWKHQHSHESESPDEEEDDLDDFEHSNDTEEDSDDEDEKHDPPKICKAPPPPPAAAPVKSQCGETINYSSSARENNQQGHVIAIDRVNVLSDRDSKIMDNVPKADEPISESTVDSTMGIVSRNMVVNDDTTDGTFVGKRHTALNAMEVNNKKVGKNIGGENSTVVLAKNANAGKSEKKRKSGFFSRLSNFRFSLRNKSKSSSSKNNNNKTAESAADSSGRKNKKSESATVDAADTSRDFIYIPLKEPPRAQRDDIRGNNENCLSDENKVNDYQHSPRLNQRSSLCGSIGNGSGGVTDYYHSVGNNKVHSKPPLPKQPPRVVGVCAKRYGESTHAPRASSTPREIDGNHRYMGTVVPTEQYRRHQRPGTTMISENKIGLIETNLDTHETIITGKTQSLMELGSRLTHPNVLTSEIHSTMSSDEPKRPHKSMEFLLDKENQRYTLPPENELQKTHDTPLSEHQLRVQASLQRLNIPDWYKQYNSASKTTERTSGTNYRKRNTEFGKWVGLNSKTTSLSSLGSQKAEKGLVLLSPSSHSHHGNTGFSRWSTSHLNSTQTSPSISGRSSFSRGTINSSYMSGHSFINPNVGTNIRSSYRQPYLGWRSQEKLSQPRTPAERLASSLLSQQQQDKSRHEKSETENAEIQTSIKEVTSAIVHYVNDQNNRNSRSRSTSPSFRKCWLESSFVGIGPVDQSPQTPTIDRSFSTQQHQISRLATNSSHINGVGPQIPMLALPMERPSPGSATLEDVLASLLGLPTEHNDKSSGVTGNNGKKDTNALTVESVPLRRHSEGDAAQKRSATDKSQQSRRVSLDSSDASGGTGKGTEMMKCRYHKCEATATVADAKKYYKSCHNCSHLYCSRECRRAHWERHRKACLHLRVSTLCRQVLSACKDEPDTLRNLSLLAKRGYLSQGRGVVRILFRSPENAEMFIKQGFQSLGETSYVRWPDLMPAEMGPELYSELLRLSTEYKPETKMLIYVAICVVSEAPGPSSTVAPVKWERQLVSRCAKLKICKTVLSDLANLKPLTHRPEEDMEILILTFNGVRKVSGHGRDAILHNVQGLLKQRGVNLRKNYPDVFQRLNSFIEGSVERFLPVTLHPKDSNTGRTFVCIIVPHSGDPDQLKMPNSDVGNHVQLVNVSLEHLDQLSPLTK